MLKFLLVVTGLVGLLLPVHAQDTTLTRLLRSNAYPLAATGSQLAGTGWERLRTSIAQSQFVLVGEDHGMAQIPQFTQAVARELQPAAFITEIDRYQAANLTRLTASPGLPTAYLKASPGSLSFFSWGEEYELAQQLRAQKARIIGIEQVGLFTLGRFYEELASRVKSPSTRAYLQREGAAYQRHDMAEFRSAGHSYSVFSQRQSALDSLELLTKTASPEARRMAQEYLLSHRIYKDQVKGLGSHQARVNLMKRNLLEALRPLAPQPGQPLPKLLFKFGASHMASALSPWSGITDVGNLVQNLADVQNAHSLHLLVMGKQGTQVGGFNPDDSSKNIVPFDISKETYLKPFADLSTGPTWQVFDLRPVRRALLDDKLKLTDQTLVALLLGYDYFVLIPTATASRS